MTGSTKLLPAHKLAAPADMLQTVLEAIQRVTGDNDAAGTQMLVTIGAAMIAAVMRVRNDWLVWDRDYAGPAVLNWF
jgi:hypothetical protein